MLWIIICSLLTIVGLVLYILEYHSNYYNEGLFQWTDCIYLISVLLGLLPLCGMATGLSMRNNVFKEVKMEYSMTKELIENYNCPEPDYGNTFKLTEKVIDVNERIARHGAFHDSPWVGVFYSEEIGNLEPLRLPVKRRSNTE